MMPQAGMNPIAAPRIHPTSEFHVARPVTNNAIDPTTMADMPTDKATEAKLLDECLLIVGLREFVATALLSHHPALESGLRD